MSIKIDQVDEISKLLAFVRVGAKAIFEFNPELTGRVIEYLRCFAKDNNLSIDILTPGDERVVAFGCGGAVAGAAVGYIVGAIPGALAGAVIGGLVGFSLAHVRIRMHLPGGSDSHWAVLEII